jgi:ElaB/YqjD/DUF883 family membrane-anchored ribosome-binding protein
MGKDPGEIRREIEETRARLGDTVEALGYKADVRARVKDAMKERVETVKGTIGGVMDGVRDTVSGVKGTVADASTVVGKALGNARKSGASGLGGTSGGMGDVPDRTGGSMSGMRERMSEMRERMGGSMSGMRERMGSMNEMRDRMGGSMGDVRHRMGGSMNVMLDRMGSTMSAMIERMEAMREQMDAMRGQMGSTMGTVRERMPHTEDVRGMAQRAGSVRENPLGLVMGAFAAGFLAGLVIPVSEYERRTVGPLRDDLLDRAQCAGSGAIRHGRAVIEETARATMTAAQQSAEQHRREIMAGDLRSERIVSDAFEHGSAVLRETMHAAKQTAQTSAMEHGRAVMGEVSGKGSGEGSRSSVDRHRLRLDESAMPRDTGPAHGTRPRSGRPGDLGDTAIAPGMPSDASQGGGLRAGTALEGGSGAQTPQDTGQTSHQYDALLDDQRGEMNR